MRLRSEGRGSIARGASRRTAAALVLAVVAAGAVAACGSDNKSSSAGSGSSAKSTSGTTPIRLATIPAFGSLPLRVAEQKGMFKKEGLDVTLTPQQDVAAGVAALGKQFDVSLAAPPIMLAAAAKGLPIRAISGMQVVNAEHPNSVLVSKSPIGSYADLKGKRVGVIALSGSSYAAVAYLLQKQNIDPKQVHFTATALPTMADQVKAGRLDAAVSAVPFFTGLKGLTVGKTDVLADAFSAATNGAQKSAQSAIMVTTDGWAKAHPQAATAFRKAIAEAIDWIGAHQSEARNVLSAWLKLPPKVVAAAPLPAFSATISAAELQPYIDIGKQVGTLTGSVPSAQSLLVKGADQAP